MAHSSDTELLARCMEELAATVLDAGDPMTYRTLGTSAHVSADVSRDAMHAFAKEHASSVGALEVVVQRGVSTPAGAATDKTATQKEEVDPRARVIRIGSFSPASSDEKVLSQQIYSVYKKRTDDAGNSDVAPISIACWSQERSLRNDIFQKVERQAPLSRAVRAFYASGIKCPEATTRTGFGDTQGEESVSVFDSVTAVKKSLVGTSSQSSSAKSFFKTSSSTSGSAASKPRASSSAASGASKATPAKKPPPQQPETKKIDAKSMSNVFTIDSDDDDEDEDGDAPVFVKKSSSGIAKPRSKRVISDDDEDDDNDDNDAFESSRNDANSTKSPAPAARSKSSASGSSSSARNVKRKLSASPDEKSRTEPDERADATATKKTPARQQQHVSDDDDEASTVAAIPTTRRVEVTKTRINEQGYMVTEKTYEEVELTAEDIEQERLAVAKKKKAAAAARAAAEAKAAAAEKKAKSGGAGSSGPAKQKNLFAFFNRK